LVLVFRKVPSFTHLDIKDDLFSRVAIFCTLQGWILNDRKC
jgi:hypothetical protein